MSNYDDFFEKQTRSSRIKALIISDYFPKYCRIISKAHKGEIHYLDLFAGPGFYDDGNPSTPILIGEACKADPNLADIVKLMFNDFKYCEQLRSNFLSKFPQGTFKHEPRFGNKTVGEDDGIRNYLMTKFKDTKGKNRYPTLLFIDPFGYKGVETSVLAEFMKSTFNEIFLFVNVKRIQPALSNNKFDELMHCLFPSSVEQLRKDQLYTRSVVERLHLIIENLGKEYEKVIGEKVFYTAFKFKEEDNAAVSHYILHFTKHARGFDLIKQIYNDFDNTGSVLDTYGTYTFDAKKLDENPDSESGLFGDINVLQLSGQLKEQFKGQKVTAIALYEQHHYLHKYCRSHYIKTLRKMVEDGDISVTFTDKVEHRVTVLISEFCILQFK